MSKLIVCVIQAFDCEETVAAAMESLLRQTYQNWLCFIVSNGNVNLPLAPNASFTVIKNFAARDRRFILLNKQKNDIRISTRLMFALGNLFPDSYLCTLDADDEYESDFFARGVALAEAEGLDIVACGTQIIRKKQAGEQEGVLVKRRQLEENLIIRGEDFASQFIQYKSFCNEIWGKLYRGKLFSKKQSLHLDSHLDKMRGKHFAPDMMLVFRLLNQGNSLGILSGTSHRFFLYERRKSTNATEIINYEMVRRQKKQWFTQSRQYSPYRSYDMLLSFLNSHGKVSEEVYEYLQAVLFGWLGDIYNVTLLPIQNEKLFTEIASGLVLHPKFDELMTYRGSGAYDNLRDYQQRIEFCRKLSYTLLGQKLVRNRQSLWVGNRPCSALVRREIDRLIAKLEKTIQTISKLQKEYAI